MEKEHADEGIFDITGRCMECHPDGKVHDVENLGLIFWVRMSQ
jgi:hypothetical protein